MEPASESVAERFYNRARERLRILGEIPVRKFNKGEPGASATGGQPLDPDGNPDTSFLAKIPADTAFTFQTLDRDGMVLNMAQTWHQLRPARSATIAAAATRTARSRPTSRAPLPLGPTTRSST
jgi:hypothetical protein